MLRKISALAAFTLFSFVAFAQPKDNSPYSRFGIGDLVDDNFMNVRHMGGLGSSYADPHQINIVNPASYSSLTATALDVGLYVKRARVSDPSTTSTVWSGNLEYISLAFPLSNPLNQLLDREKKNTHLAMAFVVKPHSAVGYSISSLEEDIDFGGYERNYRGSGGTYKFLWGNSIRHKELSFGVNLGYLFGKIEYERNVIFGDLPAPYNNFFSNQYNVSGFIWDAGVIYSRVLNKKDVIKDNNVPAKKLNIGLRGSSNHGFNTNATIAEIAVQNLPTSISRDTLNFSSDIEGEGTLPAELGIGITYFSGQKFAIGLDYEMSNWSAYKNTANPEELEDTYRFAIGGYYRPNFKSYTSYWSRVLYKYGLYYQKDPRRALDGTQITSYGLQVGLGMPFIYQRKISHASLGLNIGWKGQGSPIEESFVKLTFGFTFNDDEWFLKRKYN